MAKKLLMGNEAFAWAALSAGVNVVAGYPGTPSSELVETVAKLRAAGTARGVHVEWSTNEKAALELLAGASMAGARCLFTCKQVGMNVASDALLSLNYVGVRGGLVLFVADDPGPISSQTEQDTRRFAAFAKLPVLDPATPEQGWEMMVHAFDLSERHGTPVIVRPTTRVNHASTFFDVPEGGTDARPLPEGGFERSDRWIIFPRRAYEAHGEVSERLPKIAAGEEAGPFNPMRQAGERPRVGIVAGGIGTAYAEDALAALVRAHELPAHRFWQVGTPYPFPDQAALRFAEGLERILVLEELDYVLEDEMTRLAGRHHLPCTVHGKLDGAVPGRGELSIEACAKSLADFLGIPSPAQGTPPQAVPLESSTSAPAAPAPPAMGASGKCRGGGPVEGVGLGQRPEPGAGSVPPDVPMRPPVLCAGCPHRGSFYAVKQALGAREHVYCGDIGCYTLGNAAPLQTVDTCLCMGAGITMAQGFAVAQPGAKCIAWVGDSTFFASGMTGIANAVYNQHDITVCVLDNATTAMTGTQPHPGTGATLMGAQSRPILPEEVLGALGVRCIEFANPLYLDEAQAAAARAIDFEGPSAVIFRSPCMQVVAPEDHAMVDAAMCRGCRLCVNRIGCPAFSMDGAPGAATGGRPTLAIDAATCAGCGLCADVCPFDAIKVPCRQEGDVPFGGARGQALDRRASAEGGAPC